MRYIRLAASLGIYDYLKRYFLPGTIHESLFYLHIASVQKIYDQTYEPTFPKKDTYKYTIILFYSNMM